MSTIILTATTDFRVAPGNALVTGQDVTKVTFSGAGNLFGTFGSNQFGGTNVSNFLALEGRAGLLDVVIVELSATGSFSAAGWSATQWDGADRVDIKGTIGADTLSAAPFGSSLEGREGADTMTGGAGNDTFQFDTGDVVAGEIIAGGGGTDLLIVGASRTANFNLATISNVENILMGQNAVANFAGNQVGVGAGRLTGVTGNSAPVQTINVTVTGDNVINLSNMTFSVWNETTNVVSSAGGAGNDSLTGSVVADSITGGGGGDQIFGGLGNDTIVGDAGGDFIDGGAGSDLINGGADFDIASWLTQGTGAVINLTNQALNAGSALGDQIASIEAFYLTNSADSFTNSGALSYVYGFDGNDTLTGSAGSDFFEGGTGADSLAGGGGFDYASYAGALAAVRVDLLAPNLNTGDAAGDSYASMEAFFLTGFNDVFVGGAGQNIVFGGGGNDLLSGQNSNSNDWLFGEGGNDTMIGGVFDDLMAGGLGSDTYYFVSWVGNGFDSILDFTSGVDKFQLEAPGFGLLAGTTFVNGTTFRAAASPGTTVAQPTMLYATGLGILYFDPDGTGALPAIALAQILGAPAVAAGDFIVA